MASRSPEPEDFLARWRLVRACARCHRLKMRCTFEDPQDGSCQRCSAINVPCSSTEDPTAKTARRRPRKLAHSRTDAFEKIQEALVMAESAVSDQKGLSEADAEKWRALSNQINAINTKIGSLVNQKVEQPVRAPLNTESEYPVILPLQNLAKELLYTQGAISIQEARRRLNFFINEMLPYYPVISITPDMNDFDVFMEKEPLLLTAIMYVTTVNDNGLSEGASEDTTFEVNWALNRKLNHYLEAALAYHVLKKADALSCELIQVGLVLSLWCLAQKNVDDFRHRLHLLMALNISFCIEPSDALLYDHSHMVELSHRTGLRSLLSLYCCCGSLGLYLDRFRLVSWGRRFDIALKKLSEPSDTLPTRGDRYLCYFAKIVCLGQEIFDFLRPYDVLARIDSHNVDVDLQDATSFSLQNFTFMLQSYEKKLYLLMIESELVKDGQLRLEPIPEVPKESFSLCMIYYQILMLIHDSFVSGYLYKQTFQVNREPKNETVTLSYLQHVVKLVNICECLLSSFIEMHTQHTINCPTFFYYRPLHALILLIRLRLLLKSQNFETDTNLDDITITVEHYYEKVSGVIEATKARLNVDLRSRMSVILQKISKWMELSSKYKGRSDGKNLNEAKADFVKLTGMSKFIEIEGLKPPKEDGENAHKKRKVEQRPEGFPEGANNGAVAANMAKNQGQMHFLGTTSLEGQKVTNNSLHDMIDGIDADILQYLNPMESNFMNDSFHFASDLF